MYDLDNPGFCIACGAEADGVEPDARRYKCESCGSKQVYGADELLLSI
jgi:Zn finger protein HypA/HybF involved in hydrogenase expression